MKPTEQAKAYVKLKNDQCNGLLSDGDKLAIQFAYMAGFNEAISQMRPEWVAVTDVKPVPHQHYFALYKSPTGKLIKCIAVYTEGWCLEVECDGDEDYFNHDETKEKSYMPKGWYEECEQEGGPYDSMYFKREVAFIMQHIELPQPPTDKL